MKYLLIVILLSISVCNGYSQSNQEEKTGSWFTYAGTHRVSDKLSISTLSQVWMFELAENFNFILLYGGINYKVSANLTTSLAYGYGDIDGGFYTDKPHTYENRIFEQVTFKHKVSNLPFDHRFRVEQRFFHKYDFKSTSHRFRYRLGTKLTLNKSLFIRLNNEFLATLESDILTENRLYTALGINISKSCNVQLGYLNRKINGLNLHRLQAGLYIKTDHRKKKQ
ncbi:DUF2490 domain-containing protein [Algibacter amylolyticus]|uniref:DUF2490 domain-containing protein n=1 Tax=Algibacter amylolyticus TaxID=1608400 RepID=A0A5M7B1R1_9FLAO|nr:DUF2490 domain-containing protein [Algibacter amylolyticus]KAA5823563.1 DUF2490 domain-containing protein [Algibacter amylolyticus]MBB5267720.1 hypothetical protein [Algibacter amylolyticus]TSJ74051.1 DUF2490 domain-containing protein [Algibacter amylolyticus]